MIDLRSDTVTLPSEGMKKAMFEAKLGDDVFGEDPTVNALQAKTAEMFGHEAGLFCPSGTMTNQIAIQVHTNPGDEVICHASSHVYNYEGGGIARNSLASTRLVHNNTEMLTPDEVDALVHDDYDWLARTTLVVAEDTSNRGGGKCYTIDQIKALSEYCRNKNLILHLDGARAFNAIVARGHELKEYGSQFDSISICLSKGLGTPAGSVLIGSESFIKEARRVRKVMGGGMRQAGFLAAAGIYALDHNVTRLKEDHNHAHILWEFLKELKQVAHAIKPETNILIFDLESERKKVETIETLEKKGIKAISFGKKRIRMVTHLDVHLDDIDAIKMALKETLS